MKYLTAMIATLALTLAAISISISQANALSLTGLSCTPSDTAAGNCLTAATTGGENPTVAGVQEALQRGIHADSVKNFRKKARI